MTYKIPEIAEVAKYLKKSAVTDGAAVLRDPVFKALFERLKTLPPAERGAFGKEANALKQELEKIVESRKSKVESSEPIDVTAPWDINTTKRPQFLSPTSGTIHPLNTELDYNVNIFYRMGFTAVESREIDDDYHMFSSLNFPEGHPARDDYDTFMTDEGLIAPAHTSTMQNRVLKKYITNLEKSDPIAVVIPGRVFRNEDVDARHEHTFYQLEGVYVNKGTHVGNLTATIKEWLDNYFGKEVKIKTQPYYFPFTEPSLEFAAECIFCGGQGCQICSQTGWIELGGCGMIHPNVLKEAGIDPNVHTGFAWGFGIERLVMLKYNIEDVRHFESAKLEFLRQFS